MTGIESRRCNWSCEPETEQGVKVRENWGSCRPQPRWKADVGEKHDVARARDMDRGSCVLVMESILCAFFVSPRG